MPELRWILLVAGALLIGGLWWWELRRARQVPVATSAVEPDGRGSERFEPRLDDAAPGEVVAVPSMRAGDERAIPRGDPPLVVLDDLPDDPGQVELVREVVASRPVGVAIESRPGSAGRTFTRREPSIDTLPQPAPDEDPPLLEVASVAGVAAAVPVAPVAPVPRGAPVAPAAVAAGNVHGVARPWPGERQAVPARPAAPESREPQKSEPPSTHQRIVAIRLVAGGGERIDGAALRTALESDGLRFGRYSIFHRQRADGRALYSVASLVEPGSFDPDRMPMQQFPGISLFAVFPGPVDAPDAFDDLLATARRLADRIGGVLQDERGGPLSAQRVLGMREELVAFQNLVTRARGRPAG
jgi:cell division protein ZipA